MNKELAELIGIIIGDGYLDDCQKHYRIGIVGNPKEETQYYEYIQRLIKIVWNKNVVAVKRERGLRIVVNSKSVFLDLTKKYKLAKGDRKSHDVMIPEQIIKDWKLAKHTIRGIADTDGSIFTANKPGTPDYPSIEITTSSRRLANQLKELLLPGGFRVAKIWIDKRKDGTHTYRIPMNGYKNIKLWLNEIGFSNPQKLNKALEIIKNQKNSSSEPSSSGSL